MSAATCYQTVLEKLSRDQGNEEEGTALEKRNKDGGEKTRAFHVERNRNG
jgi:hypothetical protein